MKPLNLWLTSSRMRKVAASFGSLVIGLTATSVSAQDTVESCRKVSDANARLACYDAIPLVPATEARTAAPVQPQVQAQRGEVTVESAVANDFSGWRPNDRIALANGQVWQVVDGSTYATRPGTRKAVIRRGLLGADFMDIEGVAVSPRVRRLK